MLRKYREERDRELYTFWYPRVIDWTPYSGDWKTDRIWDHLSECYKISKKTIFRILQEFIDADRLMGILHD